MKPRVAVVSTSYPQQAGDAAGHFVASEVAELVRTGAAVTLFVPGGETSPRRGAGPEPSFGDGAVVTRYVLADGGAFGWPGALARLRERPLRVFGAAAFALRAVRALRQAGPFERVQAHFLLPCAWPIVCWSVTEAAHGGSATTSAVEFDVVGHGSDVRLFCALPSALRRLIARALLRRRARLRVPSLELAQALRRACPELARAVSVKTCPIDTSQALARDVARHHLGLAERTKLALVVARLVASKRVDAALSALSLVDDVSIVVVGDGPELAALRARYPSVRFTGRVPRPEALAWIAAADVLVSGSAREGAPTVVREARALGVPVVAVEVGDLAHWAARDEGLYLVGRHSPA